MRDDHFIDVAQTLGIVVIAVVVVYVVLRLERALTAASARLKEAMTSQRTLQERFERLSARVEAVEHMVWERHEILPTPKIKNTLDELQSRLNRLEAGE